MHIWWFCPFVYKDVTEQRGPLSKQRIKKLGVSMRKRQILKLAALASMVVTAATAHAQSTEQPAAPANNQPFSGDWLAIGAGAAITPTYNGSDDYHVIPGGSLAGNVSGHDFFLRGLEFSVDALRNRTDGGPNISLGPVIGLNLDRTRRIRSNPQVAALGKLDVAVELGAYASVDLGKGVLNPYDTLTVSLTGTHDIAGAHDSYTIRPSISYLTPLSRHIIAGLNVSGDIVGDKFANYYYGVTPTGAAASGLRAYRAEGGLMSVSSSLFAGYAFSDDFKGWSLFAVGSYTRLRGSVADSPTVRDVGDRNQWFGALGIGYVFQ